MPADASCPTTPELQGQLAEAGPRRRGRPANDPWQWRSLFAAAGFAFGDDELDADDDTPDSLPPVQRQVSATGAPPLLMARHAPASVFELAWKPAEIHSVTPPTLSAPPAALARRVIRTDSVTRCIHVPVTETQEWIEREQARRARQRPPRPTRQKFKLAGSTAWTD